MKITVLAGGTNAERQVSLNSGQCVSKALRNKGHKVTVIDPGAGWKEIDPEKAPSRPPLTFCGLPGSEGINIITGGEVVFNTLHGGQGENGIINSVLELLKVPYVGSKPGACAASMDKVLSKRLFNAVGVPTPDYFVIEHPLDDSLQTKIEEGLAKVGLPAIVKPAEEGSTVGLTKAESREKAVEAVKLAADLSRQVLVEQYIEGRELTVGVLSNKVLPVLEIVVPGGFYDYQAKYQSHDNKYICPAQIDKDIASQAQSFALQVFNVLGLEDYSRIDFRLDSKNGLWCLEANNQPGMTDSSLLPKAALVEGMDLSALLEYLIENAVARHHSSR